jgi:hypothetical protein
MKSLAVDPPSTVKLPGYSPKGVAAGTVTSRIAAVNDWFAARDRGKFKKNFVSSATSGAAMLTLSPFRNSAVLPVFIKVAENVTVCERPADSSEDVKLNVNGPATAEVVKKRSGRMRTIR